MAKSYKEAPSRQTPWRCYWCGVSGKANLTYKNHKRHVEKSCHLSRVQARRHMRGPCLSTSGINLFVFANRSRPFLEKLILKHYLDFKQKIIILTDSIKDLLMYNWYAPLEQWCLASVLGCILVDSSSLGLVVTLWKTTGLVGI